MVFNIRVQFSFLLGTNAASSEHFSPQLAAKLRSCSWNAGWYTANEYFGKAEDAERHKILFEQFASEFKSLALLQGVLSAGTSDIIKTMFLNAAWAVAKERKRYMEDAKRYKESMQKDCLTLRDTGEVRDYKYPVGIGPLKQHLFNSVCQCCLNTNF